ncbi:MAG: hypothetical protein ACYCTW_05565 [Sulfuricella sp.]
MAEKVKMDLSLVLPDVADGCARARDQRVCGDRERVAYVAGLARFIFI